MVVDNNTPAELKKKTNKKKNLKSKFLSGLEKLVFDNLRPESPHPYVDKTLTNCCVKSQLPLQFPANSKKKQKKTPKVKISQWS